jgi:hypothetical protein
MSNVNRRLESITIDTASAIERGFRVPCNCHLVSVGLAVNVAVTTATSNITIEKNGTAVTGLAFAVTTARAIGYTEKDKPTSDTELREGDYLSVVGDGGGDAGNVTVTFELQEL